MKNDTVDGYIKPLFRNVDVFDRRQDEEKNVFRKVYEGVIGGLAGLLENVPRDEVATRADIEGCLVQNAFFRAILPGFVREARRARGIRATDFATGACVGAKTPH